MWTALVRQLVLFVFTRRGKRMIAFIGVMLLCFVTAFLIDSQKYLSAGLTGILTVAASLGLVTRYFQQRKQDRERERQELEKAERRAVAAQARSEKIDRARTTVTNAAASVKAGLGGRLNLWRKNKVGDAADRSEPMGDRG